MFTQHYTKFLRWHMVTTGVTVLQHRQMSNHYVVNLKLI